MFPAKLNVLTSNTTSSNITTVSSDQPKENQHYQHPFLSYDSAIDWTKLEDKEISKFFIKLEALPNAILADLENHKRETSNADNQLSSDSDIDWKSIYEAEMIRDPVVKLENPPEPVLADAENNKGETSNADNQLSSGTDIDWRRCEDGMIRDPVVKLKNPPETVLADVENDKGETSNADGQSGLTAANSSRYPATGNKYDALGQMLKNSDCLNLYESGYGSKHHHKCDECGQTFKREGMFKRHKKNHKSLYRCTDCNVTYKYKSHFVRHKETHSDERPFICDLCSRSFKSPSQLKYHKQSHRNDRPFVCGICNKAFKKNAILTKHKQTHGQHRFECDICKKSFIRRFDALRHRPIHQKKKPFKCPACNKEYSSKRTLIYHVRQNHPDFENTAKKMRPTIYNDNPATTQLHSVIIINQPLTSNTPVTWLQDQWAYKNMKILDHP